MAVQISKKYTDEDFGGNPNLDEKILIFENRVKGWQLDIAEAIRLQIDHPSNYKLCRNLARFYKAFSVKPIKHAGFAILSILFSYFEMITQYERGTDSRGKSIEFLKKGLESVFPAKFSDSGKSDIANLVRNGLYHSSFTKKGVLLSGDFTESIGISGGIVEVNPHLLVGDVSRHFDNYIADLKARTDTSKVTNFELMYDKAMNP